MGSNLREKEIEKEGKRKKEIARTRKRKRENVKELTYYNESYSYINNRFGFVLL